MTISAPVVRFEGVAARVGVTTILRDVDVEVEAGEAVGLFGPNGAGKTTLLRMMATLMRPAAGDAWVLGASLAAVDRFEVRPRIGLIGHQPALYPELTIEENLQFVARVSGAPGLSVGEALEAVGLSRAAKRQVAVCSFGMQRRVEFARELLREPHLLLLDEPHSALDSSAVGLVDRLVGEVLARGGAAVLVSHDRDRVEKLAERSLEVRDGTL